VVVEVEEIGREVEEVGREVGDTAFARAPPRAAAIVGCTWGAVEIP
jgi:hypothetical protein